MGKPKLFPNVGVPGDQGASAHGGGPEGGEAVDLSPNNIVKRGRGSANDVPFHGDVTNSKTSWVVAEHNLLIQEYLGYSSGRKQWSGSMARRTGESGWVHFHRVVWGKLAEEHKFPSRPPGALKHHFESYRFRMVRERENTVQDGVGTSDDNVAVLAKSQVDVDLVILDGLFHNKYREVRNGKMYNWDRVVVKHCCPKPYLSWADGKIDKHIASRTAKSSIARTTRVVYASCWAINELFNMKKQRSNWGEVQWMEAQKAEIDALRKALSLVTDELQRRASQARSTATQSKNFKVLLAKYGEGMRDTHELKEKAARLHDTIKVVQSRIARKQAEVARKRGKYAAPKQLLSDEPT